VAEFFATDQKYSLAPLLWTDEATGSILEKFEFGPLTRHTTTFHRLYVDLGKPKCHRRRQLMDDDGHHRASISDDSVDSLIHIVPRSCANKSRDRKMSHSLSDIAAKLGRVMTRNLAALSCSLTQSSFARHPYFTRQGPTFLAMNSEGHESGGYKSQAGEEQEVQVKSVTRDSRETASHDSADVVVRFQPSKVQKSKQSSRARDTRRNDSDDNSRVKVTAKPKSLDKDRRFGCPFSKHSPERYEQVYGRACTNPPGLEGKRIVEHLRRVHSVLPETKCRYCGHMWETGSDDQQRIQQLSEHLNDKCNSTSDLIYVQPEYMNSEQEEVVRDLNIGAAESKTLPADGYWVILYMRLFPGEQIPRPDYDYFVARHLATTLNVQNSTQPHSLYGVFPVRRDTQPSITATNQERSTAGRPCRTRSSDRTFYLRQSHLDSAYLTPAQSEAGSAFQPVLDETEDSPESFVDDNKCLESAHRAESPAKVAAPVDTDG